MFKKTLACFLIVLFSFIFCQSANASGFNLKNIGGLSTEGREISHWWYSSTKVNLSGEASADSSVAITIDEKNESVTADSNGDWSYNAGDLGEGDHTVSLANNGSTINFTLTLGSDKVDWDVVGQDSSNTALPTAGVATPTILLLTLGSGLFLLGKRFLKRN